MSDAAASYIKVRMQRIIEADKVESTEYFFAASLDDSTRCAFRERRHIVAEHNVLRNVCQSGVHIRNACPTDEGV